MQVIGNLGKDCVTNLVNGKNVINFNVAHTEKFRDATGKPEGENVVGGLCLLDRQNSDRSLSEKRNAGVCGRDA